MVFFHSLLSQNRGNNRDVEKCSTEFVCLAVAPLTRVSGAQGQSGLAGQIQAPNRPQSEATV